MAPLAIVIGASTGIGRALAVELAGRGYRLGLAGRSAQGMAELQRAIGAGTEVQVLDVAEPDFAAEGFKSLIQKMGGCDVAVINAGIGFGNPELDWAKEKAVIDVNVAGFVRMADEAFKFFAVQGRGHMVGISSVAAIRGYWHAPAYNASKAFISNYMEGLRGLARHRGLDITITDVRPGFVDTPMTKNNPRMFWVATPETAARQISGAIANKCNYVYVTRRWRLVAWALRWMPECIRIRF